jgi:hypothetical protein
VTSAQSCNNVGHLFWFTILAQHETNDVIMYIHSVHKCRGNTFQRQNYKMRLKQRSLNWINSMQVKKILFTNVFFSWSLCDVIGLVLRENCKSKQMTGIIAWPSRCYGRIYKVWYQNVPISYPYQMVIHLGLLIQLLSAIYEEKKKIQLLLATKC